MIVSLRHMTHLLLASVLLMATGCINDGVDGCSDTGIVNTAGYMSIMLRQADGQTRAGGIGDEFSYGEASEFALSPDNHPFALVYTDEQAAPIAVAALSNMSGAEGGSSDKNANSTAVFATIVTKSQYKDMLERLQECFVILNADLRIEQTWNITKSDLLGRVVDTPFCKGSDGKLYFTMCNSVYAENGKITVASKVDTDKIFTSYMEAIENAWKGNAAVNAYVERVAAKFGMRFANEEYNAPDADRIFVPADNKLNLFSHLNNDGIPYYGQGDYSYKVRITGWGMNALEKESYLFRKINPAGNYFDGWSNSTYRRSLWSEDLNYSRAVYPWQYRRAADKPDAPYYAAGGSKLKNLSYEELNAGFGTKYRYTLENTYDFKDADFSSMTDSRIELLAGTHVIVCAEMLTNIKDGRTFGAYDLYRDRNGNFYGSERDCFTALVTVLNNSLKSHSFLKYTYYNWDKGGEQQTLYAWTKGEYSLYYNNTKLTPENIGKVSGALTADATVIGGDGKRFIWMDGMSIKDDSGNPLEIYSNIDEVDVGKNIKLRTATVNDTKSLLLQAIGAVDHFKDGKMYYAVPVGYIKKDGSDDYSVYGVVRNSVYDILIHDVTGLGTSVDNDTEPIIPNKVSTNDHLFIGFDIIDWHLVEQTVSGAIN